MKSPYFSEEHEAFREAVRKFMENEIAPHAAEWEAAGRIPRSAWKKLGEQGFLGIDYPEKYGGVEADFFYSVVFLEELSRSLMGGFVAAVSVHAYMASAYVYRFADEALRQKYLVPAMAGEKIGSLAISEPNAGSDVGAIHTRARKEGEFYVIDGSKTFITNGVHGDFIVTAVKTDTAAGAAGISLILIDRNAPGVSARKLEKIGWRCSDTAELSFDGVKVPMENLIGEPGMGFYYIMECFQLERLVAAITSVAGAERCYDEALKYIREREAFGRPIAKFQVIRHRLADLASEIAAAREFSRYAAFLYSRGENAVRECSMAKLRCSELAIKAADVCLQCFGGYGYMEDYPIARMYRDARVGTIVGGTSDIMREIIAKIEIDGITYFPKSTQPDAEVSSDSGDLPRTAADLLRSLPERFLPQKAADWNTCFHFQLKGDGGGNFTVKLANGKCVVKEGLDGDPECVLKAKAKTYFDIETGRLNPQVAFMTGRLKVSNVNAMLRFMQIFKPVKRSCGTKTSRHEEPGKPSFGPLNGLRVLDVSRLYPGPLAAAFLGQMGAEVIKLENAASPDPMRQYPPFVGDEFAGYLAVNHSKRSPAR